MKNKITFFLFLLSIHCFFFENLAFAQLNHQQSVDDNLRSALLRKDWQAFNSIVIKTPNLELENIYNLLSGSYLFKNNLFFDLLEQTKNPIYIKVFKLHIEKLMRAGSWTDAEDILQKHSLMSQNEIKVYFDKLIVADESTSLLKLIQEIQNKKALFFKFLLTEYVFAECKSPCKIDHKYYFYGVLKSYIDNRLIYENDGSFLPQKKGLELEEYYLDFFYKDILKNKNQLMLPPKGPVIIGVDYIPGAPMTKKYTIYKYIPGGELELRLQKLWNEVKIKNPLCSDLSIEFLNVVNSKPSEYFTKARFSRIEVGITCIKMKDILQKEISCSPFDEYKQGVCGEFESDFAKFRGSEGEISQKSVDFIRNGNYCEPKKVIHYVALESRNKLDQKEREELLTLEEELVTYEDSVCLRFEFLPNKLADYLIKSKKYSYFSDGEKVNWSLYKNKHFLGNEPELAKRIIEIEKLYGGIIFSFQIDEVIGDYSLPANEFLTKIKKYCNLYKAPETQILIKSIIDDQLRISTVKYELGFIDEGDYTVSVPKKKEGYSEKSAKLEVETFRNSLLELKKNCSIQNI